MFCIFGLNRQWKKINITDFKNDFTSSNLAVNVESDMHTVVQQFNHGLMYLIDKHAPLRERVVTVRPKAPWYNSEIDTAKRLRRKLEHKWLKTKSQIDHDNFRQQCAVVNDLILKSKETFYNGKIEDCDGDQNFLFKVIDKILHNNDVPQLPSHNSLDVLVNKFADYFIEKIQSIREQITGTDAVNSVFDDENVFIGTKLSSLLPASEDEVRMLISRSSNKSCCLDPIPAQLIKLCMDQLVPIITLITNMSLTSGVMPSNLKEAVLIPLLKKICLDPELFKNFRPVSNLTFLSKLIERVVALGLHDHMKINNLYEEFQSSYRKFHSTETALTSVHDDILRHVDEKQCVILLLLDLSAAFDTIDHNILLSRLQSHVGVCDVALQWFRSYLSERKQSVLINGVNSFKEHAIDLWSASRVCIGPNSLHHIYVAPW